MPSTNDKSYQQASNTSIVLLIVFISYLYVFIDLSNSYAEDLAAFDYVQVAIVLSLILLIYPLSLFSKIGYKAFLRTDVLVSTSLIYWTLLDLVQQRYTLNQTSSESVRYAFTLIAVFAICVQYFSRYNFQLPDIVKKASSMSLPAKYLVGISIFCFLIGIFPFWRSSHYDFYYMVTSLIKPRFSAPWARASMGGFEAFFEHLKYFGYVLPSLTSLLFIKKGKFSPVVIVVLFMTLFFTAFEFQLGGRRIIGFLFGSGIATYLVARRNELNLTKMAIVSLMFVGLVVLLDMQLQFRRVGYEHMFEKYEISEFEEIRVDDNFLRISQIIEFVPDMHPYSGMQYLIWAFGRPIPRFFWEGKPMGPGFDLAAMADEVGVSLSMTVIGEAYASFGIIMVILIAAFYGILAGSLNRLMDRDLGILGYAIYALGTMAMVAGVRSLVDMIIFSYAILGILVIYRVYLKNKFAVE